ncbi:MAG: 4-hydroxy-3-methylbut-2-enyl diphosphate reductase [Candidatus Moranbacteria bacterium CG_4_9_14_3_um_filter_42_9]|nr:MAG: 4-hydroxy-3-methylbut-2-enyl diphosphate reductase [Candidatus Moranbacteria bacterium CG_4_9_14_3_um_filter_42_9]
MQINLSQFAGFCDGVRRAFETVSRLVTEDPQADTFEYQRKKMKKPVFVLGSLVHNQDVVNRIEEKSIKKISLEKLENSKPGEIGTIIITAHGIGPRVYEIAKAKGIDLIDTTCPKVIKVQRLARSFVKKGYNLILVGDKDHKEVKSIYEWGGGKALVISSEEELQAVNFDPTQKIIILSQTTQSQDFLKLVYDYIKKKYKDVEIIDTICMETRQRQDELKKLAERSDAMVIIGSTESANSTRLYEISKKINPKSVFVSRVGELDDEFFADAKKVGVTAGASTPEWIISEVIEHLSKI